MRQHGVGYLVAVLATAMVVLLRWLLDPWMGGNLPFVTVFGAVAAAVWYGGWRPAVVATVGGYAACDFLFIAPRGSVGIPSSHDFIGLVLYLFTCSLIIGIGEAMRLAQRRTLEGRELLRVTFASIGDAIITTDTSGHITYLNGVAESVTGWTVQEAVGRPLDAVFRIVNEETRNPVQNPVDRALREGVIVGLANHTILIRKDGAERPIDDSAAPIRGTQGHLLGCVLIFRDITQRRRAEAEERRLNQQLQERVQELQTLLEILPVGVWMGDAQCRTITGNRVAYEMIRRPFGQNVSLSAPELRAGKKPGYRVVKDGQEIPVDELPMQWTGRTGQPVRNQELDVVLEDGTAVSLLCNVAPLVDAQGNVRAVIGAYADISERRRTEHELRRTEEQTRSVVNNVIDGIIAIDERGLVQSLNPAAERLFGYPASEVLGQNVRMLMPEPYHSEHDSYVNNYLRTGKAKIIGIGREVVGRRKDGSTFPMELGVSEFHVGVQRYFSGIVRDITERKRTETERQLQSERLRLLWETAAVLLSNDEPDAMLRGLFARIRPHLGLDAYFNFMVNEGSDALRLESCDGIPDDAARKLARLEFGQAGCGAVALQRHPMAATFIQQSDDPRLQLVKSLGFRAYACNPLVMEDRLFGTLTFASRSRDQFDADELDFLRTICHYVTVAYERVHLIKRLREADRRKDEFLATLAHELRNPLAPVRNAVQILQMKGSGERDVQWARDIVDRQVQQMTRLIDDLMDVSRISRGKIELRRERIQLANVVQGAVETSRPIIQEHGHNLTVSLPPQALYLHGDLTRLAQVFANLLNNAAKYTEPGGRIELAAERQGSDVLVAVKDSGIGIPADKLRSIFEMFSQAQGAMERSQGGLGIGLSLVKSLVEMHGGSIEARSEGPGQGSEFVVRLPIVVQPDAPAIGEPNRAIPTSNLRVLIVDDNKDAADTLEIVLRATGNTTRTAYDGEQAIQAATEFQPDVALLDIGLPKKNGYDVCRYIRQQPWGKNTVLIAVTGWSQEEDRLKAEEAGFDRHLAKPVNPRTLMNLLAQFDVKR